mmetsp:Transcript_93942/g.148446  ORF Transcript_93942/g.148446 Transcript_93942/m.148446 type:complete len:288 (+) Transcript_93942:1321-2184(+)
MYSSSSFIKSCASTSLPLSSAISVPSLLMLPSVVELASLLVSSFSPRLVLRSEQALSVFPHSISTVVFSSVKSFSRDSKRSTISCEWYLYSGSLGSTAVVCWRKPDIVFCFGVGTNPIASARFKVSRILELISSNDAADTASSAFLLSDMALMAAFNDEMALFKSAAFASYSAFSLEHRDVVSSSSLLKDSFSVFNSPSFVSSVAFKAVFSAMEADNLSMVSCPSVIEVTLVLVVSLQKHANFSYVAASSLPSVSISVFKFSRSEMTFSTGVTSREVAKATFNTKKT